MDAETAALIADLLREEQVAAQDRLVAEMVSRGEELPPLTPEQRRVSDHFPLIQLDSPAPEAVVVQAQQRVDEDQSEIFETQSISDVSSPILQPDAVSEKDADTVALDTPITDDDHLYASSWAATLITDAAYLDALITAEEAAAHDRLAAEMLSRGKELPPQTPAQSRLLDPAFDMHIELAVSVAEIYPAGEQVETKSSGKQADRSATPADNSQALDTTFDWGALEEYTDWNTNASVLANTQAEYDYLSLAAGPSVNRNKWVQCTVCYDSLKYSDALQTPCDHNYCTNCIVALVEKFIRDETYFPLRCCQQPIPPTSVDSFLSSSLRATFAQKHAEFSFPAADRLYCAQPACTAFLGSASAERASSVGGALACRTCGHAVCLRCREPAHGDEDCA